MTCEYYEDGKCGPCKGIYDHICQSGGKEVVYRGNNTFYCPVFDRAKYSNENTLTKEYVRLWGIWQQTLTNR